MHGPSLTCGLRRGSSSSSSARIVFCFVSHKHWLFKLCPVQLRVCKYLSVFRFELSSSGLGTPYIPRLENAKCFRSADCAPRCDTRILALGELQELNRAISQWNSAGGMPLNVPDVPEQPAAPPLPGRNVAQSNFRVQCADIQLTFNHQFVPAGQSALWPCLKRVLLLLLNSEERSC